MQPKTPKPRIDKTIVTIKCEREGEETILDRQSYPATVDKVCKQLRGLTGRQAYELRTKRYVQFDNSGWLTTVSIQEITAQTDLGPAEGAHQKVLVENATNAANNGEFAVKPSSPPVN